MESWLNGKIYANYLPQKNVGVVTMQQVIKKERMSGSLHVEGGVAKDSKVLLILLNLFMTIENEIESFDNNIKVRHK